MINPVVEVVVIGCVDTSFVFDRICGAGCQCFPGRANVQRAVTTVYDDKHGKVERSWE